MNIHIYSVHICLSFVPAQKVIDAKERQYASSHTDSPLTAAACTEGEGEGMHGDGLYSATARLNTEKTFNMIVACFCHVMYNVLTQWCPYNKIS